MFINSKKNFEINQGDRKITIPCGYIGEIPEWVASHWMIQAAIKDGSVATPQNTGDKELEAAEEIAVEKADAFDKRHTEEELEAAEETDNGKKPKNGK